MHPRQHLPAAALYLADEQYGILTTAQLRELGVTESVQRRLAKGWTKLERGIYSVDEPTWRTALTAGLIIAGPDAAATGLAAGWLHGMLGREPSRITISHDHDHALHERTILGRPITFRRLGRHGRGSPSRASVEDSLVDVAAEADELTLVGAVTRALGQRFTTAPRLAERFAGEQRAPPGPARKTLLVVGSRPRERPRVAVHHPCRTPPPPAPAGASGQPVAPHPFRWLVPRVRAGCRARRAGPR
ncbi:hypothetical protein ACQB6R_09080 [Propionibacteriaceae bacterium G1746]|uniref:hypothetical protein n=1 Tax=Aestuariimicrobium sp. G57 TaxID=3418485 RepID=UPI003C235928